jgi:hypothetical protein
MFLIGSLICLIIGYPLGAIALAVVGFAVGDIKL